MRLYLSSYRIGNCPDRLIALARGNQRLAVVGNALDMATAQGRAERVQREVGELAQLGFAATELDLRDYFEDPRRLAEDLRRYDALWVHGGNTFVLRYALARSGADAELTRMIEDDAIVYTGYSAGACVLAPSLRGLETVDDAHAVLETYGEPAVWDGLGVLDYAIVPHVDSPEHPESVGCGRVAHGYRATGVPHRTLRDGEVLVIDGANSSLCR